MASYIQGLTDYIPKAEPYKPNFDFLNTVLATRQARYDSALNQLSGAYGSILYADLTRDDNRVSRDNFLNIGAVILAIWAPVAVPPVKLIAFMSGCSIMA